MTRVLQKKLKLGVETRHTKWAPFWAAIKKYGQGKVGKGVHPSQMTARRRHWRRTKLKITPRKARKSHFG